MNILIIAFFFFDYIILFTVTVKRFNFFNFLISYYSLFISITYVIVSKYLYFILSIIYFD